MQVETTLRECATILLALGHKDPHRATLSQEKLDPTISKLMRQYKEADPPPVQQMALPALVFHWLTEKCSTAADPALSALADLMVLAFFFLFCVGDNHP
jgi:hypothetical protein